MGALLSSSLQIGAHFLCVERGHLSHEGLLPVSGENMESEGLSSTCRSDGCFRAGDLFLLGGSVFRQINDIRYSNAFSSK